MDTIATTVPAVATREPYYVARGTERDVFAACARHAIPVLLKGPTGCGKTRFVEYMAWRLQRPLITIACHDDLSASDLTGRFLLRGDETVWVDGPLTTAARTGAICYLDEVIEARADTLTVLHPLADERRLLPLDKTGELLHAAPGFLLVVSYNPGYQRGMKELKHSFRQRFAAFDFDYPEPQRERDIVVHEGGVDQRTAERLVRLAQLVRRLKEEGLPEGAGTRSLVAAARLIAAGVAWSDACTAAIGAALTDDADLGDAIRDLIAASDA